MKLILVNDTILRKSTHYKEKLIIHEVIIIEKKQASFIKIYFTKGEHILKYV